MLTLETEGNLTAFIPGSTVTGRCSWDLTEVPREVVLRLFWYTEGRGTQDLGIVDELAFSVQSARQEESFRFQLPPAPYSMSGSLLAIRWALELVIDGGEEVARLDLLVSPWETEVVLTPVPGAHA